MPAVTKEKLLNDIRNGDLKGVYLLYGPEQFLVSRYGRNIRKVTASVHENINASRFVGTFADSAKTLREIREIAETMPFFSGKRVIEISGSGFFKPKSSKAAAEIDDQKDEEVSSSGIAGTLSSIIGSLPDTCVIVFEETDVDKRTSLYKQVLKAGTVTEFPFLKASELKETVRKEAKRMEMDIEPAAVSELVSYTGEDLWTAVKELEKLRGYCFETGKVTLSDVRSICVRNPEDKVFDMVEAMSSGRQMDAMRMYRDMLALGRNSFQLLSLVIRDYNLLLAARDGLDRGLADDEIKPLLKCMPFIAWRYIKRARATTRSSLIAGLEKCAKAQSDIKTGMLPDRIAFEILIAEGT